MAALGLCCCTRALSSCGEQELLFVAVRRLLIAVASLCCGAWALGVRASVVVAHGLSSCGSQDLEHRLSSHGAWVSCSTACGIRLDQGSNPCSLHWQVDPQPLRHQGSPLLFNVGIYCYKFPSQHCFHGIQDILVYCMFIFICL